MVVWLRSKFPHVPILALNSPATTELAGADYNVTQNGPEVWLPLLASALRRPSVTD